jgi:hypothetical protein
VSDHLQSSVLDLLLPRSSSLLAMQHLSPAHHETRKCDSSNETRIMVKLPKRPGFEFKHRQVNDSSRSNQEIDHLVSQTLSLKTFLEVGCYSANLDAAMNLRLSLYMMCFTSISVLWIIYALEISIHKMHFSFEYMICISPHA